MLDSLDGISRSRHRLWRADHGAPSVAYGRPVPWTPTLPHAADVVSTPDGPRWFGPFPETADLWVETDPAVGPMLVELLHHVIRSEREVVRLSQELAARYEEIDLLYTISEILGQTVQLEEAAQTIVRAVSSVVGARRASIVVFDDELGVLKTVASQGIPAGVTGIIPVDDPVSIAARVYRERRVLIGDPIEGVISSAGNEQRGYRGVAFMSVPICYAAPGAPPRCVGVVNLTDRVGGDRFVPSDRKLVVAVANQIGAAVENARLAKREREQQRLENELELARQLQLNLLPNPSVLAGDATVAVRCLSMDSVGGDFYTFSRLGLGSVGVMVGDVASHGFSAALIMALVLSAAGIHASLAVTPDEALTALRDSLAGKLSSTDSYLTCFYAVIDPINGRLTFANAGHPYAFRISKAGTPVRLEATAPPLGLAPGEPIGSRMLTWVDGDDLLCVWTDGLADAANAAGERFGEPRILEAIITRRAQEPEAIVDAVIGLVEAFAPEPADDRTLLVLRL
ncbi:MAG: GAF domain-containing SpoIIE family protein phosphatase [Gemmatimonadota bacterium]